MRSTPFAIAIPAIIALCALSGASVSAMDNDNASARDKNVKALENVPAKVKDAMLKESQGREIRDVDQVTEDGRTVYRAKIQRDGKDLKIDVTEDGHVISRNDGANVDDGVKGARTDADRDASVNGKRKVDDAKDKADHEARKGKDEADRDARKADREGDRAKDKADRELSKDKASAEAKAEKAKDDAEHQKREAKHEMDEHGTRDTHNGVVTIDQVPAAVKATLEREAKGLPIGDIDRDTEDGRTVYEARIKVQNGQDHTVKVGEDGQLVSKKD